MHRLNYVACVVAFVVDIDLEIVARRIDEAVSEVDSIDQVHQLE